MRVRIRANRDRCGCFRSEPKTPDMIERDYTLVSIESATFCRQRGEVSYLSNARYWPLLFERGNVNRSEALHMKTVRISAAFGLLMLLSFACVAQDKSTATIKGKVKVEKGSPAGVSVTLLQGDREITRGLTEKNGGFVISHIVPGTYSVKFRKPGLSIGTI